MSRRPVTAGRLAVLACSLVLVAGCGRSVNDGPNEPRNLEQWTAEVRAHPAPPLDPLPVMQQFETFEYAAQDLRDPFSKAFTDEGGGSGPRPDPNRARQAPDQFPPDSLTLVRTLAPGINMRA